ncbi:PAS domain S-box protein [Gigaspora margarita]|uniref:PAS domain S-box protein n=1 Tax=Gigaspora margarita TaxID=4874 RepID=A0A8H4EKU7_GIGMA|nr:PAS domain S-box protein [Gigaspora margarita]
MSTYSSNIENEESDFANIVYNYDWSSTLLGPMESWDISLKNAVNLCLKSTFPIAIAIFPCWIIVHNKAWKQVLKGKHPHVIGKQSKEIFPEAYEIFTSGYENVRITGKGTFKTDQLLELQRDGYAEEAYFSYSYNPIFKSDNSVCAIFILAQETTQNVLNTRRLKTLDELSRRISEAKSLENTCNVITKVLSDNNADIPYALIYFIEHKLNTAFESLIARLIATTFDYDDEKGWLFPDYIPESPKIIDLAKDVNKCYNTNPELNFLECDSWPIHSLMKKAKIYRLY